MCKTSIFLRFTTQSKMTLLFNTGFAMLVQYFILSINPSHL